MEKEPAVIVTTTAAFLTAIFGAAAAFGLDISDTTQKAILGCVGPTVALLVILGPIIRQFVYSPKSVKTLVATTEANAAAGTPAPPVVP